MISYNPVGGITLGVWIGFIYHEIIHLLWNNVIFCITVFNINNSIMEILRVPFCRLNR